MLKGRYCEQAGAVSRVKKEASMKEIVFIKLHSNLEGKFGRSTFSTLGVYTRTFSPMTVESFHDVPELFAPSRSFYSTLTVEFSSVSDVSPKKKVRLLSFGWLQASHRKKGERRSQADEIIHEHRIPEPLITGTLVALNFTLTPTANLFKRGHQLRLEIGSRPDLLKATVFDGFVFYPYEPTLYPARNTIFIGEVSHLFLNWRYVNSKRYFFHANSFFVYFFYVDYRVIP